MIREYKTDAFKAYFADLKLWKVREVSARPVSTMYVVQHDFFVEGEVYDENYLFEDEEEAHEWLNERKASLTKVKNMDSQMDALERNIQTMKDDGDWALE